MKTLFAIVFAFSLSSNSVLASGFKLKSNLKNGSAITADYYASIFGCSGKSLSPELEWSGAPKDTKSFALTFYDKDAPTGSGFWHYVLYNIPSTTTKFASGDLTNAKIPAGSVEGNTDVGKPGYFGPCPPVGRKHHYIYTVYALKTEKMDIPAGATAAYVGFNTWMNTLDKATLEVTAGPRK
jgi:Raf kinase inhibitor-like YbhB/YbcL family protein